MGGQDARRLAVLRVEELRRVFLADLRAGFLAADFFAVRRELAEARTRFVLTFPRLLADAFLFLGARLLLIAFRAFFATVDTASPTALPALTARSLAPSMPAFAVSTTAAPVPTTAAVAVLRMPSLS
jgi:hypothetical protein